MKRILVVAIIGCVLAYTPCFAQLQISGKLRTLRPITITIEDLNGKLILRQEVVSGQEFKSESKDIKADLYVLSMGDVKQNILLENKPLTVKGFFDDQNVQNSQIVFDGIDLNNTYTEAMSIFKGKSQWNWEAVEDKYSGLILTTMVYENQSYFQKNHEKIMKALSKNNPEDESAVVISTVKKMMEQTATVGSTLENFALEDENGNMVSSDNFKGKIILIDFWASWCGPCKAEMKKLKKNILRNTWRRPRFCEYFIG